MRLRMLQCTENKMLFDCDTLNICTVSDAQDAAIECCTTENGFSRAAARGGLGHRRGGPRGYA